MNSKNELKYGFVLWDEMYLLLFGLRAVEGDNVSDVLCQEREIHGDVRAVELLQQRDDACHQDGAVHRLFFVAAGGGVSGRGRSERRGAAMRVQWAAMRVQGGAMRVQGGAMRVQGGAGRRERGNRPTNEALELLVEGEFRHLR